MNKTRQKAFAALRVSPHAPTLQHGLEAALGLSQTVRARAATGKLSDREEARLRVVRGVFEGGYDV